MKLAGKKLAYNYGDYAYHLEFKTETKLHWECVKGDEKGKSADETYVVQELGADTYFVSWIEADGLGVSQVINLNKLEVNCFLKAEKDIITLKGTIKIFNK